jgi:hypothetical protein
MQRRKPGLYNTGYDDGATQSVEGVCVLLGLKAVVAHESRGR